MKLTDSNYIVLSKIDFYNRYRDLSDGFRSEIPMTTVEIDKVQDILNQAELDFSYDSANRFFKIKEKISGISFSLNIVLNHGVCEFIFGSMNENSNQSILSGPFHVICKLIEMHEQIHRDGYFKHPAFENYHELTDILQFALSIYNDLKDSILEELSEQ